MWLNIFMSTLSLAFCFCKLTVLFLLGKGIFFFFFYLRDFSPKTPGSDWKTKIICSWILETWANERYGLKERNLVFVSKCWICSNGIRGWFLGLLPLFLNQDTPPPHTQTRLPFEILRSVNDSQDLLRLFWRACQQLPLCLEHSRACISASYSRF